MPLWLLKPGEGDRLTREAWRSSRGPLGGEEPYLREEEAEDEPDGSPSRWYDRELLLPMSLLGAARADEEDGPLGGLLARRDSSSSKLREAAGPLGIGLAVELDPFRDGKAMDTGACRDGPAGDDDDDEADAAAPSEMDIRELLLLPVRAAGPVGGRPPLSALGPVGGSRDAGELALALGDDVDTVKPVLAGPVGVCGR